MEKFMLLILFFLLLFLITAILTLKIRIDIQKFVISNIDKNGKHQKIKLEHRVIVKLYIFNYIKIFSKLINKRVTNNITEKVQPRLKKINKSTKEIGKLLKFIKNMKLELKDFNFVLNFGIEDVNLLIYTFTLISTIIPFLIRKQWKNIEYSVAPIYNNGNLIDLRLKGIVDINLVHIIYTSFMLKKKGRIKNGRKFKSAKSSNRKSYEYSHE